MLSKPISTDFSCYNDSEKKRSIVWHMIYDIPFCSYWGQRSNFWFYRGHTGKNAPILLTMVSKCLSSNTIKNQNSLPYVRCFVTMVTYSKDGQPMETNLSHSKTMLTDHRKLFWLWIVFTRRAFWYLCQQNWIIFTCLSPVEPYIDLWPFPQ